MNRRTFVRASGIAAAMGISGLAGCNGLMGGGGGSGARSWQYDPNEVSSSQMRFFGSMQIGQLYEMRDQLPESMQTDFDTSSDSPVSMADVDVMTGVGGGRVEMETDSGSFFGSAAITGSFDAEALRGRIESEGSVEQSGEYNGYTLYEGANLDENLPGSTLPGQPSTDATATVAVDASAVIFGVTVSQTGGLEVTGRDTVETMIDANAGNVPRLAQNSEHVNTLQSTLGDATFVVGGEVEPELIEAYQENSGSAGMGSQMTNGLRAGGFGGNIGPSTTTYDVVIVYDSADNAQSSGIVGMVGMFEKQMTQQEGIDRVASNRDGATITVTIEGDTETLLSQGQGSMPVGGGMGGTTNAVPSLD